MRYLIDTDWLIDVLAGVPAASTTLDRLASAGLGTSIITVGELYEGAVRASEPESQLAQYRGFLAAFPVLPLTDSIMLRFATLRAQLRHTGALIPDFDLLIASTALEEDLVLLTRNRKHFERIPELALFSSDDHSAMNC